MWVSSPVLSAHPHPVDDDCGLRCGRTHTVTSQRPPGDPRVHKSVQPVPPSHRIACGQPLDNLGTRPPQPWISWGRRWDKPRPDVNCGQPTDFDGQISTDRSGLYSGLEQRQHCLSTESTAPMMTKVLSLRKQKTIIRLGTEISAESPGGPVCEHPPDAIWCIGTPNGGRRSPHTPDTDAHQSTREDRDEVPSRARRAC